MTEFELIKKITSEAPRKGDDLICGVGDDSAVITGDAHRDWVVTTDALVENVHFRREWTGLATLGRKALAVNLSDIAAMGATPRFYLVSIALPPSSASADAEKIYAGLTEIADEHKTLLIGGDTVASNLGLVISITVIGEAVRGKCLYRSGARPGDSIYVTGTLGSSALGLLCLKRGIKNGVAAQFIKRHLDPRPRIKEAAAIAKTGRATAMIDVSDGLLADLAHIADESGVGFTIEAKRLPAEENFVAFSKELLLDPVTLALSGGEDYELLFTGPENMEGPGAARIGSVAADKKMREIIGTNGALLNLDKFGFDHFG